MKLKLLGSAINAATTATRGSAFDGATLVYCLNTNSAAQLVTVCNSSNVTQGSFQLMRWCISYGCKRTRR